MALLLQSEFEKVANQFPEKTAIFSPERNWTYKEIYQASKNISLFLYSQGIKKGERVAVILENGPEWPIIYFGIITAGAVCVPIDTQCTSFEINNLLKDSESKLVLTSVRLQSKIENKSIIITDMNFILTTTVLIC